MKNTKPNEKLFEEITEIRPDIIDNADNYVFKKKGLVYRKSFWTTAIAAVLIITITVSNFPNNLRKITTPEEPTTILSAEVVDPGTTTIDSDITIIPPVGTNPPDKEEIDSPPTNTEDITDPSVDIDPVDTYSVASPVYPKMSPYPDFDNSSNDEAYVAYEKWIEDFTKQTEQAEGHGQGMESFYFKTMKELLTNSGNENKVYSPLNIYFALGMLAEITDGDTRNQILKLLDKTDVESLRTKVTALWNANYCDDGVTSSILANSLWLNQNVNYNRDTVSTLANSYFASTHQGIMGSDKYNKAIQGWLNQKTGGLLKDSISDIVFDPETVLSLASTIYFKAKWSNEFNDNGTYTDTFHALSGDVDCKFMHDTFQNTYYWSERFSSIALDLENSGSMVLILPDEGVSIDDIIIDKTTLDFMLNRYDWENAKKCDINLAIPMFDITSNLDLKENLQNLGITNVFDSSVSNFTPITDTSALVLNKISHNSRVLIDEKGCIATAYTTMALDGTSEPIDTEKIDFILNRPFIFAITGYSGQPLFIGVVNQP